MENETSVPTRQTQEPKRGECALPPRVSGIYTNRAAS